MYRSGKLEIIKGLFYAKPIIISTIAKINAIVDMYTGGHSLLRLS